MSSRSGPLGWTFRDCAAGLALFLATAGVILWQNAHIVVLWDLSYVLDTAARIAAGQMPYRDFPLVHTPLTFVVQAAIMRLTGRTLFHHTMYVAMVGGLSTVLTWRMVLRLVRGWWVALLVTAPLTVVGIYCILPHPSYDCDCAFWMLTAMWCLLRLEDEDAEPAAHGPVGRRQFWRGVAAGATACMPVFFKQNMGLPFLAAVMGAVGVVLVLRMWGAARGERNAVGAGTRALWGVPVGAAAMMAVAVLVLHFTAGVGNFVQWTVRFAGQRRMPSAGLMLSVYSDEQLLWTLPCMLVGWWLLRRAGRPAGVDGLVRSRFAGWIKGRGLLPAGLVLMVAPFATMLIALRYDDGDYRAAALLAVWPLVLLLSWALGVGRVLRRWKELRIRDFFPLILLAAITGTFMSKQLWGSTYAIWPLLVLLIAELMTLLPDVQWIRPTMAMVIGGSLLLCGALYTASEERLEYEQFPDGPAVRSTTPQLKGMATPGNFVPELDEMLRYAAANIPAGDGVVLIPGEDPFYFATGRTPQYPVLLFDPTTDPYTPAQAAEVARERGIRWLIVKRNLQMAENPAPEPEELLRAMQKEFTLVTELKGYDVYRRP